MLSKCQVCAAFGRINDSQKVFHVSYEKEEVFFSFCFGLRVGGDAESRH